MKMGENNTAPPTPNVMASVATRMLTGNMNQYPRYTMLHTRLVCSKPASLQWITSGQHTWAQHTDVLVAHQSKVPERLACSATCVRSGQLLCTAYTCRRVPCEKMDICQDMRRCVLGN